MRSGSKEVLITLGSFFALLKPNTGKILQYRSKSSCSSNSWFFLICTTWLEVQFLFSLLSWFMSKLLTYSRRLWPWVSFSKHLPSSFLIVVPVLRKKSFICALHRDARPSSAPRKDETRWSGSELKRNIGSSVPKVWRNWCWNRYMLSYPHCCVCIFEGYFFDTNWLKLEVLKKISWLV